MDIVIWVIFTVLVLSAVDAGTRKDDEWPPKDVIDDIQPFAQQCHQETGVSQDKSIKFDFFFF